MAVTIMAKSALFKTVTAIVAATTLTLSVATGAVMNQAMKKSNSAGDSQLADGDAAKSKSIDRIELTNTYGLIDEYTIYYTDDSTSVFIVTNGASGAQGIQGFPGLDGHTPVITIGDNGNWVVDGVDTGTFAQGRQGEAGVTPHIGDDGHWYIGEIDTGVIAEGHDGRTPLIGANGNWWIGGTDTGVPAQGATGRGVESIEKTDSQGLVDVYTITYTDGTTSTFLVTNGADGTQGQGVPGQGGYVPEITIDATTGNWVVDGVDTGVHAEGPQGPAGLSMHTGEGQPDASLGRDGDSYIDLLSWDYWVMDNGTWVNVGNIHGDIGTDGSSVKIGHGDPTTGSVAGNVGDTYIDLDTGYYYIYDENNGWGEHAGTDAAATCVLTGNGIPTTATGKNGDSYIDLDSWDFYVRDNDVWAKVGNIKGGDGAQGSSVNVGHGDPTTGSVAGHAGDTYIDLETGNYYNYDENNGWGDPIGSGAIGSSLRTGTTAPAADLGNNGDSYINTTTWDYYVKENGAWVLQSNFAGRDGISISKVERTSGTGAAGTTDTYTITYSDSTNENPHVDTFTVTNGTDGNKIIVGTGAPTDETLANVGDNYIDVETWKLYVKAEDSWTDKGSFKGDAGQDGVSIVSVTYKESNALIDVYEITYSDSTQENPHVDTFTVTNGKDGTSVRTGHRDPRPVEDDPVTPEDETLAAVEGIEGDSYIDLDTWNFFVLYDDGEGNLVWSPEGNLHYSPNRYVVTFDSNGGSAVDPYEEALEGFTIQNPTAPTQDGYFFQGWYTAEGTRWDFSKDVITKDTTLTARWGQFIVEDGLIKDCSITSGDIVIPEFYDNQLVIGIADEAFKGKTGITSFTLPRTVKSIGNSAFEGCTGLTSVVIPSNVKSIGTDAFKDCSNVVYVYIEDSAANPGISPLRGLSSTNGLETIGNGAFAGCSHLKGIVIPNSVKSIGLGAFQGCSSLESYSAPFVGCSNNGFGECHTGDLVDGKPDNSVGNDNDFFIDTDNNSIWRKVDGVWQDAMFIARSDDNQKGTITTGSGAPSGWADYNFYVDLDTGEYYEENYNNSEWKETPVAKVEDVFMKFGYIFADPNDAYQVSEINGAVPSSLKTIVLSQGNYSSDQSCYYISQGAFQGCSTIETVILPETLKVISAYAFDGCEQLTRIDIPSRVTTIESYAFAGCLALESLVIPDSVTNLGFGILTSELSWQQVQYYYDTTDGMPDADDGSVGDYRFDDSDYDIYYKVDDRTWVKVKDFDDSDENIYFGEDLVPTTTKGFALGDYMVDTYEENIYKTNVNSPMTLQSLSLPRLNGSLGSLFGASSNQDNGIAVPASLRVVIVGGGASIGDYAFANCEHLTTIALDDSITTIGNHAFENCAGLSSFALSENVTSLGDYAFSGCANLTAMTLSNNLTAIGNYAFAKCLKLESLIIPDSVTSIGNGILAGDFEWDSGNWYVYCYGMPDSYDGDAGDYAFDENNYKLYYKVDDSTWIELKEYTDSDQGKYFGYELIPTTTNGYVAGDYMIDTDGGTVYKAVAKPCSLVSISLPRLDGALATIFGGTSYRDNETAIPDSLKVVIVGGTTLGEYAFANCSSITMIALRDSVTTIGAHAFENCSTLTSFALPNGVTTIGDYAFSGCANLTAISLGDNLLSIGDYAFKACSGLTSFVIPESVTHIGKGILASASGGVKWNKVSPSSVRYLLYINTDSTNPYLYLAQIAQADGKTEAELKDYYDFVICVDYHDITNSYDDFEYWSYTIWSYYETQYWSGWYDELYNYSFYILDENIQEAAYGEIANPTVEYAGDELWIKFLDPNHDFYNNYTFTDYELWLWDYSKEAIPLETLVVPYLGDGSGNNNYLGYFFDADDTDSQRGLVPSTLKNVVITGDQDIGANAFYDCVNVENIKLVGNVQAIGDQAFMQCEGLKEIGISNGVQSIGESAFDRCSALTTLIIPNSVTSIGDRAFYFMDSLKTLSIPFTGNSPTGDSKYFEETCDIGPYYPPHTLYLDTLYITGPYAIRSRSFTDTSRVYNIVLGDQVTGIEANAFKEAEYVKSVILGNGITSISESAFKDCTGLLNIVISEKVTSIGASAFEGCSKLISIIVPYSVTSIGASAFKNCSSLANINVPYGVTTIEANTFQNCSALSIVNIPTSVTSIGNYAFQNCIALSSVFLPDSVTTIGEYAYQGCSSIGMIRLSNTISIIGDYAFKDCASLTSLYVPSSIAHFGKHSLVNCTSLKTLSVPFVGGEPDTDYSNISNLNYVIGGTTGYYPVESTTALDTLYIYGAHMVVRSALYNSNVKNLVIGADVTFDYSGSFRYCSKLETVTFAEGITALPTLAFENCTSLRAVYLPSTITSIGNGAFFNCASLPRFVIPDGITAIGSKTFSGCSSLSTISIPDTVLEIGFNAFEGCESLASIVIPDTVTTLGISVFSGCSSLVYVKLPVALASIPDGSFMNCKCLAAVNIPVLVSSIGDNAFRGCSSLTGIALPSGVTSIGARAFEGCESLASIMIPTGIEAIGEYTFCDCKSLVSVYVPVNVLDIGKGAFKGCSSLENMTLPFVGKSANAAGAQSVFGFIFDYDEHSDSTPYTGSGIFQFQGAINDCYYLIPSSLRNITIYNAMAIPKDAFYNCAMLETVAINNPNATIGSKILGNCTGLVSIVVPQIGTGYEQTLNGLFNFVQPTNLKNITVTGNTDIAYNAFKDYTTIETIIFTGSVENIAQSAFSGCTSLQHVTLPTGLLTLGDYAFYNCRSLTEIVIPNTVTTIGELGFKGCINLETVELSPVLIGIEDYVFQGCAKLSSIVIPDTVTYIGNSAFDGCTSLKYAILSENSTCNVIFISAFHNCSSLDNFYIPNSVTRIEDYAFDGCSFKTVVIPNSVTKMGQGILDGNEELESLTLPFIGNGNYIFDGSDETSRYRHLDYLLNRNYTKTGTRDIPASLKTVIVTGNDYEFLDWTFDGCSNIKNIVLGGTTAGLGECLKGCTSLEYLEIPTSHSYGGHTDGVTMSYLFGGLSNVPASLKTVVINGGDTNIYDNTFKNCAKIENIIIKSNITHIGASAFNGCSSLVNFNIPSTVASIGSSAFSGCGSLVSVIIPDGVTAISSSVFEFCASLEYVDIPSSVTQIGDSAFACCEALRSIELYNISNIGMDAFLACTNLTYVDIYNDDSGTHISTMAFGSCESLTNLYLYGVNAIDSQAFQFCRSLYYLDLCNLNHSVAISDMAFMSCTSLTTVVMGEDVTSIGQNAFEGCFSLNYVCIGANCASIGDGAFEDCHALSVIEIHRTSATTFGNDVFKNCYSISRVVLQDTQSYWTSYVYDNLSTNDKAYFAGVTIRCLDGTFVQA